MGLLWFLITRFQFFNLISTSIMTSSSVLLGKHWSKFSRDLNGCWQKMIHNYSSYAIEFGKTLNLRDVSIVIIVIAYITESKSSKVTDADSKHKIMLHLAVQNLIRSYQVKDSTIIYFLISERINISNCHWICSWLVS